LDEGLSSFFRFAFEIAEERRPSPNTLPQAGEGQVLEIATSLIHHIATTTSTNDDVAALARDGAPEGTWLRADSQRGGRGRHGRQWASPPGNLYASTLVRLAAGDPAAHTLAMVAALALDQVLQAYIPANRLMIKWPNDLLADGAKISGILLDGLGDAVVVGIGVNLAHHPDNVDRPATSVASFTTAPEPGFFLSDLAASFAHWLARWRGEGLGPTLHYWRERAHPPGTALTIRPPGEDAVDGLFDGLDEDGALRLRLAGGEIRTMHAGDVFLL
jgi:BirA family biotin operon repressor/biotin-[acetyl-CoA-carboxylase] ligase